mgnify:CR=1 FL=1
MDSTAVAWPRSSTVTRVSRPSRDGRFGRALFDVGSHILAGEFQESVDEYRDIPGRLRARAVLSEATARRLFTIPRRRAVRPLHLVVALGMEAGAFQEIAAIERLDL